MNATETDVLDETILDDEPGCEFAHGDGPSCSTHVTHRVIACVQQGNTCDVGAADIRARMHRGGMCYGCKKAAGSCWELWPI